MEPGIAAAATGTAGDLWLLAAAVAAVAGAAAVRRLVLRHNQFAQRHALTLTIATRLAWAALMPQLRPWAPSAGDGALATAAATVLHPEVSGGTPTPGAEVEQGMPTACVARRLQSGTRTADPGAPC